MDSLYMEYDYLRYLEATMEEQSVLHNTVLSMVGESYNEAAELQIFTEGVGEKVKNGWAKFVAWIKKVWAKFLERLAKTFSNSKGYLEQYKDIILKKKVKEGFEVEMADHSVGIKRIFGTTVDVIQPNEVAKLSGILGGAKIVAQSNGGTEDDRLKAIQEGVVTIQPWAKMRSVFGQDVDFNQDAETIRSNMKQFFLGGKPRTIKTDDSTVLNMSDMYEFCYESEKIVANIEKDKNSFEKSSNTIANTIEGEAKKINDANVNKPNEAPALANMNHDPIADKAAQAKQQADTVKQEAAIHEVEITQSGTSAANAAEGNRTTAADASKNNIGNQAADDKDYSTQGKNIGTSIDNQTSSKANATKQINLLITVMNRYRDECVYVLTSEMHAANEIAKDYMQLIRAHVQSYVGTPNKTEDNKVVQGKTNYP